jgi:hypothetical protein
LCWARSRGGLKINSFRFSEKFDTVRMFRFGKRGVRPIVTEREAECDGRDDIAGERF